MDDGLEWVGFDIIVFVRVYIVLQLRHGLIYVLGNEHSLYDLGRRAMASSIPHAGFVGASVCSFIACPKKNIASYRWQSHQFKLMVERDLKISWSIIVRPGRDQRFAPPQSQWRPSSPRRASTTSTYLTSKLHTCDFICLCVSLH